MDLTPTSPSCKRPRRQVEEQQLGGRVHGGNAFASLFMQYRKLQDGIAGCRKRGMSPVSEASHESDDDDGGRMNCCGDAEDGGSSCSLVDLGYLGGRLKPSPLSQMRIDSRGTDMSSSSYDSPELRGVEPRGLASLLPSECVLTPSLVARLGEQQAAREVARRVKSRRKSLAQLSDYMEASGHGRSSLRSLAPGSPLAMGRSPPLSPVLASLGSTLRARE